MTQQNFVFISDLIQDKWSHVPWKKMSDVPFAFLDNKFHHLFRKFVVSLRYTVITNSPSEPNLATKKYTWENLFLF